jgi:hemoglobin-like flavoprotein
MGIHDSLNHILHSKDEFGRLFYQQFLESYPDVNHHFARVDMKRQAIILTTALMVIERFYSHPTPAIELYMRYLGTKHRELGVGTADFPKFFESMFQTLKSFHGDQWNPDVERQWREAFERTTSAMFEGYLDRVQV